MTIALLDSTKQTSQSQLCASCIRCKSLW